MKEKAISCIYLYTWGGFFMQSFIFDYYGYNANVENNEFEYEGYKFLLLSVEDDEKDIIKLND